MADEGKEKSSQIKETVADEDEELSALLESAVKDFGTTEKKTEEKEKKENSDIVSKPTPPDTLWSEDFLQTTASRFEQNMAALFSPGADGAFNMEQLSENIQRLAEASTQAAGFESSPDNEFSSIISQTLRNIAENAENIQAQFSEEELMNMLGSLGNMPDGGADSADFLPYMQKMMQSMLSKEVLTPAVSSIVEKYPAWLEENKGKISNDELAKRTKQYDLMKKVLEELDTENPEDSEEVKNARMDKLFGLMQDVQDCGQPPAELLADQDVNEANRPSIPGGTPGEQCCLQ